MPIFISYTRTQDLVMTASLPMIPLSGKLANNPVPTTPTTKAAWQQAISHLITDPQELLTRLNLDSHLLEGARQASKQFPLKVPEQWLAQIQPGNLQDPLLKQILPLVSENDNVPGYCHDPLQEASSHPVPGLLHKYQGRVLVMLTSTCAIHCRYCFRRHFPYADHALNRQGWPAMINYISQHDNIHEVILSGGDPLTVSDKLLAAFCDSLMALPHIQRLRFHSRVPIVLPERITPALLTWIQIISQKVKVVMVVHANHANEITEPVKTVLLAIRQTGCLLLNQSVLLHQVNDHVDTLVTLSETLFEAGVLPYYLHLLDPVQGSAHFDCDLTHAKRLYQQLSARLPGYLVPKLVREIPGATGKTMIMTADDTQSISRGD